MKKILLSLIACIGFLQVSAQTLTTENLIGKTFKVLSSTGEIKIPYAAWFDAAGVAHGDDYDDRPSSIGDVARFGVAYSSVKLDSIAFTPKLYFEAEGMHSSRDLEIGEAGVFYFGTISKEEEITAFRGLIPESLSDADYERLIKGKFGTGEEILSYNVTGNILTIIVRDDYSLQFKIESLTETEMSMSQINPTGFSARLRLQSETTGVAPIKALQTVSRKVYSVDGRRVSPKTKGILIENGEKRIESGK